MDPGQLSHWILEVDAKIEQLQRHQKLIIHILKDLQHWKKEIEDTLRIFEKISQILKTLLKEE